MKNAIVVHGCCNKKEFFNDHYPSASNSHWIPWLQKQLIKVGIETQAPEFPTPYTPKYEEWRGVLEQFHISEETILIGHSCGAGFLLRWLGENEIKIDKLILVAPWLDPIKKRKGFLDFEINSNLESSIKEFHIFVSDNETVKGVKESVEIISNTLQKATIHAIKGMGHFTFDDMKSVEFPALLEICKT